MQANIQCVYALVGAFAFFQGAIAQGSLNVVHWGDLHGRFSPNSGRGGTICTDPMAPDCYGGLARIATACKGSKSMNAATVCLDAGDSFAGAYWADNDVDFSYLAAMNTFVDAYVVGNHDFSRGLEYLGAFADAAEFPVLGACNMDTSAEPLLDGKIQKWATFKRGGLNIAVLGYVNVEESKAMNSLTKNLEFTDHTDEEGGMAACIAEFKAQNPGQWVIGILSSAGVKGDQALIKSINTGGSMDVTWVAGGHDHDAFFKDKVGLCLEGAVNGTGFVCSDNGQEKSRYTYPLPESSGAGEIYLLHAGWAGKYAGQATMSYGAGGMLAGANGVMVPMGRFFDPAGTASTIPDDPQVAATLAPDLQALLAAKTETLSRIPFPLTVSAPDIFQREVVAGGVLCQSLLWSAQNLGFIGRPNNPVVCLQNAATIRRTLPIGTMGEVSISNIETMMPPEEGLSLTIMEVSTSDLKLALENGVSALNTAAGEVPDGRFLHVGAMQFNYNLTGAPYSYNRSSEVLESPGSRVSGITYDCEAITSETVRVVMNNQLAAGVDAYFSLKNGTEMLTFGPMLGEALAGYLEAAAAPDGLVPNYNLIIPPQINAPCNVTGSKPFEEIPAPSFAWAPIGAAAAAPPPGAAAPPPVGSELDGNLAAGSPTTPGALQATTDGNVTTEAGSGVGGLHAFSSAAIGAIVLALALAL